MSRCNICGQSTSSNITINDKRFPPNLDHSLKVCSSCFTFWSSGNDNEIMKRIKAKLDGTSQAIMKDLSEALRQIKEGQDNNEN